MKICKVKLKSAAPYSQSRAHETAKLEKETADAHEARAWREKCHSDDSGRIFIPGMAFKQAIDRAAAMLRMQIPGKGKSEYTKHFLAGCIPMQNVMLSVKGNAIYKDDLQPERVYCNADGKRGSGTRVWRIFPTIPVWEGIAEFAILDETLTRDVVEKCISEAGKYVGVGRFRAQNGGMYGRFITEKFTWSEA